MIWTFVVAVGVMLRTCNNTSDSLVPWLISVAQSVSLVWMRSAVAQAPLVAGVADNGWPSLVVMVTSVSAVALISCSMTTPHHAPVDRLDDPLQSVRPLSLYIPSPHRQCPSRRGPGGRNRPAGRLSLVATLHLVDDLVADHVRRVLPIARPCVRRVVYLSRVARRMFPKILALLLEPTRAHGSADLSLSESCKYF